MKLLVGVIAAILLSGCSSISARTGRDTQLGKPFSGVSHAIDNAVECNIMSLLAFPLTPLLLIPVSVTDIALSAASDVVMLPIDLIVNEEQGGKPSLCHVNMSH